MDFITLKDFYEGVGANARATLSVEADLQDYVLCRREAATFVVGQVQN